MRHCVISTVAVALALSGCASGPKRPALSSGVIDEMRAEGLNMKTPAYAKFIAKTKSEVVTLGALNVASVVMGGGYSMQVDLRNKVPEDGYLDVSAWTLTRAVVDGGGFLDPGQAMDLSLRHRLAQKGITHNPDADYSVVGSVDFWGIDYEKLTGSDNYRLYFDLRLTLKRGLFFARTVFCSGASLEKHGYDEWMTGDGSRIRHAAAVIGDSCASRMLAELDLADGEPVPLVLEAGG